MQCRHRSAGSNRLRLACCLAALLIATAARAESIPPEFHGQWAQRCSDPAAPRITLESGRATLSSPGRTRSYSGIDVSRTWLRGAKASGNGIWFLISTERGKPFAFIAAAERGARGPLVLEEGHSDHGRELKSLFGRTFHRCSVERPAQARPGPASASSGGEPAYVGRWARREQWCSDPERRIRFTARGTEEVESICDFDRVSGGDGRWSVRQSCHVEGTTTRSRLEIRVDGDGMTLIFPDRRGNSTRLVRCP